jgi:hypothetical protein
MSQHTDCTRNPELPQPLNARPHRRRPSHPEQKQKNDQAKVPQRKRSSDNAHDHKRHDEGATSRSHSPETD